MIITKMPNILKKKIKGFTLVEVLVSVAIIGILVSLSVIASTNVRLKTRDTKRLSDISSIVNALQAYYDSTKTYPTMIFPGQPIASNGITFLKAVPSNPMPRTDGGCVGSDYTYVTTTTGYKLTFCIGSNNGDYPKGIVICKNGNCLVQDDCGEDVTDRDGFSYRTIEIGGQCWMAQNLRTITKPDGTQLDTRVGHWCSVYPSPCPYPDPTYVASERYCMQTVNNCNPPYSEHAVYTWYAAMNVDPFDITMPLEKSQGLCPDGWHIPSHDEFTILERSLCDDAFCDTHFPYDLTTTGPRGDGEGIALQSEAGFDFGYYGGSFARSGVSCPINWPLPYCTGNSDDHFGSGGDIWTSTTSGSVGTSDFHKAWFRNINTSVPTQIVRNNNYSKFTKFSVRCIKN
ncbi:prepilin-type N-terminal cleavage/methylation domain-containing protein [Candidatus Falkowbacteria bacterium]|nr:MAG: prepilin-type N-terminal cleavage/methylation domain-containing protein [Candidatus Falkowbacteria bacterium]